MVRKHNGITGVVLAGGKSSRMGQDKGLQLLNGELMVSYSIAALKPVVNEIILIANTDDYARLGYAVHQDLHADCGPIGGIEAGLHHARHDQTIVLSCDIPRVETSLLCYLLDHQDHHPITIPTIQGKQEPMIALYHRSCLPQWSALLDRGERKLWTVAKEIGCQEIELPRHFASQAVNVNTMNEFKSLAHDG